MKKTIILLSALMALSACTHKEGVPDGRQRLSTVYTATTVTQDGEPYYTLNQQKAQQWMWDGKEVYRIDYTEDMATYSENIFYDKKHRIVRTTIPAKSLRSEFLYDGRKLQQIEVFKNDQLNYTLTFTHERRKIATIEQTFAKGEPTDYSPLHLFLPEEVMDAMTAKRCSKGQNVRYKLTWIDDNVTRITDGGSLSVTFAYDSERNPLRDLYDLFEIEEDDVNIAMLSKNNPTRITRPYREEMYDFHYQYTYEHHYPVSRSVTYSYTSMNDTTFEDCLVTVTETRKYQYQ